MRLKGNWLTRSVIRAHYLDERSRMMQAWAGYLDALKKERKLSLLDKVLSLIRNRG